jgi:hypothetical protein
MDKDGYWKDFERADSMILLSAACLATFITNLSLETFSFVHFCRLSGIHRQRNSENLRLLREFGKDRKSTIGFGTVLLPYHYPMPFCGGIRDSSAKEPFYVRMVAFRQELCHF